MEKTNLKISGMTCGGCVSSVNRVLSALNGVVKAEVSLEKQDAMVDYDASKVNREQLKRAVTEAGFEVVG